MNNRRLVLGGIVISFWLNACSVLTPTVNPAIDVYTLTPEMKQAEISDVKAPSAIILALSSIRSPQGLMSTGIVYRDVDYGFNHYAYSRWSDTPSQLLENYLQQSLAESQHVLAVIPVGSRSRGDVLLEATLVDFSHHLGVNDSSSTGIVSIMFYLINPHDRALLATKKFTQEVMLEQNNAKGATLAINQATKIVADELQAWLALEIENVVKK